MTSDNKCDLIIKRYQDVNTFLSETEEFLRQQEIKNTFVLTMAYQQQQQQEEQDNNYYCGAVWNAKQELVFAIFALDGDFLYASSLLDSKPSAAIDFLLNDVMSTSIRICGLHGYQPVLNHVRDFLESQMMDLRFEKKNAVWSLELKASQLIASFAKPSSAELRVAVEQDLNVTLRPWTKAFVEDCFGDQSSESSIESICQNMIASQSLYLLCVQDKPVSMAWKVRPLHDGCSLAYVYTPEQFRHQGYAAACVSMVCEEILKINDYITLFVDHDRNPRDNLYTRVGFHFFGEAGRLVRL
jgi:predicted GNAT family acetyltransferase